jgi:hypothetical protein
MEIPVQMEDGHRMMWIEWTFLMKSLRSLLPQLTFALRLLLLLLLFHPVQSVEYLPMLSLYLDLSYPPLQHIDLLERLEQKARTRT